MSVVEEGVDKIYLHNNVIEFGNDKDVTYLCIVKERNSCKFTY